MDDWREPNVKGKQRYLNLLIIGIAILGIAILGIAIYVFLIHFLVIVIVPFINSNVINFKPNNLDVVGTFAVIVAGFALLYASILRIVKH